MQAIKTRADLPVEVKENSAYANLPGILTWVGHIWSSWRHALHNQELIQLIAHLLSNEVVHNIFATATALPARLGALALPPFSDDPDYQLVIECIRRGRSFHTAYRWATIELRFEAFCE